MATKSKRHIHKYYRAMLNGDMLWTCALPDCMHHMPKHYENAVLNKAFYCWECGEISQLRKEHLALDSIFFTDIEGEPVHPKCIRCAKNLIDFDDMDSVIKEIVGEK